MSNQEDQARAAGKAITEQSIRIIHSRLKNWTGTEEELDLITRVAHTTGDVDFARTLCHSPGAIAQGVAALKAGRPVLTDVTMVLAGIRKQGLAAWKCQVLCLLDEPETFALAAETGLTRSAAAIRRAAQLGLLDGAVVAIGNAPTALFELLALARAGGARPALVIGVPVGFVGAAESKEELAASDLEYLTLPGERGGSPIAAALVNGIAALAAGGGRW